jgi:hypothetical protein
MPNHEAWPHVSIFVKAFALLLSHISDSEMSDMSCGSCSAMKFETRNHQGLSLPPVGKVLAVEITCVDHKAAHYGV